MLVQILPTDPPQIYLMICTTDSLRVETSKKIDKGIHRYIFYFCIKKLVDW